MASKTYDEAIGDMRTEYDLDLSEVFNEDDLKNAFNKLDSTQRPDAKETLKNFADKFFEKSIGEVQPEVTKNFNKQIEEAVTVTLIEEIPLVEKNVRDESEIKSLIDERAIGLITSAETVAQIITRVRIRNRIEDTEVFDEIVETTKKELILEHINEEIARDITLFEDLSPSKLKSPISPSGVTITTSSARTIKEKVLKGQTITEDDIQF